MLYEPYLRISSAKIQIIFEICKYFYHFCYLIFLFFCIFLKYLHFSNFFRIFVLEFRSEEIFRSLYRISEVYDMTHTIALRSVSQSASL